MRPHLAFGKAARHLVGSRRLGGFSGVVREATGGETMESTSPSLSWKRLDVYFFPLFPGQHNYGNFVIFLDSESERSLARGRAGQTGQIKMTTKQRKLM